MFPGDGAYIASADEVETGLGYCQRLGCGRMHVMAGMTAHGATEDVFAQVRLGLGR